MGKIIAFAGRKRSGKTTFAGVVKSYYPDAKIYSFAGALKGLCASILDISLFRLNDLKNNNGEIYVDIAKDTNIQDIIANETGTYSYDIKQIVSEMKPVTTVRELLQVVGTNIIRQLCPDWHVRKLEDRLKAEKPELAVIDDVRFPNEKEALEYMGARLFFVCRPDDFNVSNHPSETSLTWHDFTTDDIIVNKFSEGLSTGLFRRYISKGMNIDEETKSLFVQPFEISGYRDFVNDPDHDLIVKYILEQNTVESLKKSGGVINYELPGKNFHMVLFNPLINEQLKLIYGEK